MTQAQQKQLHEEWLRHPVTQEVFKIIQRRYDYYKQDLQDRILVKSDAEYEMKARNSMETTKVLLTLISETEQFIKQINV